MDLNNQYHLEMETAGRLKKKGFIEDYKGNESVGVVWVKAEGEWIEVWNWTEVIESHTTYNNA